MSRLFTSNALQKKMRALRWHLIFAFLVGVLGLNVLTHITHQSPLFSTIDASPEQLAHWFPWVCPFFYITGFLCPGCGLTRSLIALLQGNIIASISYHPLGPLIHLTWMFFALDFLFLQAKNLKNVSNWIKAKPLYSGLCLILLLLWTIYRNF